MAPKTLLVIAFALAVSIQATLGEIRCEDLNEDSCAFAVSTTGKRCVLESRNTVRRLGMPDELTCRTSEITASYKIVDHIETEECITACGLDKKALGISSDSLLDSKFIDNFCSESCYNNCPNIVDLYFNLAAAEGVYIATVCESHRSGKRRGMLEGFKSLGTIEEDAMAPVSDAPAEAPAI